MDQKKIGEFIKQIRKETGLTQRELAEQLGMSDKTISKWECGNGLPDFTALKPLCKILHITVNELLSGERISSDTYSMKAEENMMSLLQENENSKKGKKVQFILGGVLAILALFYLILGYAGGQGFSLWNFFDVSSAFVLALICAAGVFLSGARGKKEVIEVLQKISIPAGTFMFLVQGIILIYANDSMTWKVFMVNIGVCALSLIYAMGIYLVLIPVRHRMRK